MRVLVVWESKHGSTADIALAIGEVLRGRGLRVGDFRDWDEIRRWAGQIADELTKDRLLSQRG